MAGLGIDLKNPRQMILIAAVIGLGAFYLYINFLLRPQIRDVVTVYSKAKRSSGDVATSERERSQIESLKKQVAQYHGKIESYERMLPAEQEIPKLLENLSDMAKGSGVKIVGITPLPSKDEARSPDQIYQEIPILISARSGYHEVGKFLSRLENAGRFMKVADLSIKENKTTPKRHDVELLVLTYVLLVNK